MILVTLNILSEGFVPLLLAASAFFVGILAGLFFAYSVSVVLALKTFSASAYTIVMQSINNAILNVAFGVVFIGSIAVPTVSASVVLLQGDWTSQYGPLVLLGTAIYLTGTIAVTMNIHLPMNESIATWSPASPPDDWTTVRTRWARWNHVRAIAAVISFVIYLSAIVSTLS